MPPSPVAAHPYRKVAIAAVHNTTQARQLDGHDSLSITIEAALGVLETAGVPASEVDGVGGERTADLIYLLGLGPSWVGGGMGGVPAVLGAASAIAAGECHTVLIACGGAAVYDDRAATAPWTRPANEFVLPFGMYTALEFALIARRHMAMYGTSSKHLAEVAATIRNNGHVNPEAVYYGRGPYTPDDILASRMVADPFHLLDCSMTGEGGGAMLLTSAERAADLPLPPVYILGGGIDQMGPSYRYAPSWDLVGASSDYPNGYVGRRAAERTFATAGLRPSDVDVCEFYDPFSFEIIRQFEAFGFCQPGEGPEFVMDGRIGPGGQFPTTTDGGLLSYSHAGGTVQMLQRIIRGVQQLQGQCRTRQVAGAEVALCSNGGAGALFTNVILLGRQQP
jgi:acetyl-CoA acetyltransferase